jgi:hypothetical protein
MVSTLALVYPSVGRLRAASESRVNEDDDFDKHFATASAVLAAASPAPAPAEASDANASPAPAPAAEPVAAPTPSAPAPAPAASTPAPAPAPLSVEQLQAELAAAQNRERASASRASTTQRQLNDLQRQFQELQQRLNKPAPTPAPAPAPRAPDVLTQAPDLEAAVRARAEELVKPIIDRLDQQAQRVDEVAKAATQVQEVVDPIAQRQHDEAVSNTHQALDKLYGQAWRQTVNDDKFGGWLQMQPDWVKDLYQNGVTVEDSATVLGRYYAVAGLPQRQEAPAPTPPAPAPAGTANQERLRQAAGIAARGGVKPAASGPDPNDFDANFEAAAAALKKRA